MNLFLSYIWVYWIFFFHVSFVNFFSRKVCMSHMSPYLLAYSYLIPLICIVSYCCFIIMVIWFFFYLSCQSSWVSITLKIYLRTIFGLVNALMVTSHIYKIFYFINTIYSRKLWKHIIQAFLKSAQITIANWKNPEF